MDFGITAYGIVTPVISSMAINTVVTAATWKACTPGLDIVMIIIATGLDVYK